MRRWIFVVAAVLLGSCGGGDVLLGNNGVVQMSMTDAPGDFYSYVVDVSSIQFKRSDGAMVEALPARTHIDLAEYTSMAEVFGTVNVPEGEYVAVQLTLDYTNARIVVPDPSGAPIPANPVDTSSNPLTTLVVTLNLGPNDHIVVSTITAHVALDFDLAASNSVDNSTNPATVTVQPVLYANGVINDRVFRVAGALQVVDQFNHVLSLDLQPFDRFQGTFGRAGVTVTTGTRYDIDDTEYAGSVGLGVLAGVPVGTPIVAYGSLDPITHGFVAALVLAGAQVRGPLDDVMRGVVVARSGSTLTVLGLLLDHNHDTPVFGATMTVDMSGATTVFKAGTGTAATGDVSVGQGVLVFGTHDTGTGNTAHMNAGFVRMGVTPFGATIVQVSPLVVNVQRIYGVPISRFNFAGTGTSGANDADPTHYQVDTGSLSLSGLSVSAPVRVLGFPGAFGAAPPDFAATAIVDASQMLAVMGISWTAPGTAAPFTSISSGDFVVDMSNAQLGALHHVVRDGIVTDLTGFSGDVTVDGSTLGRYAIVSPSGIEAFSRFADFSSALTTHLGGGDKARLLGARGRFDDSTVTETAPGAAVIFQ